ncbi:MAG: hypothetical protein AAF446_07160 [Pseudomonadota bacterium]
MARTRLGQLSLLLMFYSATGLPGVAAKSLEVGQVTLDIQMDQAIAREYDDQRWNDWLSTSLRAVKSVTGDYPQSELQVQLIAAPGNQTVRFARVRRSSPPQVHFYVNPDASRDELLDDWHSYHEFAHLLIPFPGNRDIWFTEGLASYYQYILQARAGVIDTEEAWRRLLQGFERGLNDRNGHGQDLRWLSPAMRQQQAYRRVYWTGAAYFLRVDTRLRTESNGEHSLDSVLAAFNQCCVDQRRRWNATSLIDQFGQLSLPHIWQEEYDASIDQPAEPEFAAALERLGIRQSALGIRFSNRPDARALRQAIASGG